MKKELPEYLQNTIIRAPLRDRILPSCEKITATLQRTLDRSLESENQLKEQIELTILKTVITKKEIRIFVKNHGINQKKLTISEQITALKLVLIEQTSTDDYSYISLSEDMQNTIACIIKILHNRKINNDLYRIVSMKGEEIAIAGLTYITGVGFLSLGCLGVTAKSIALVLRQKVNALSVLLSTANASGAAASNQTAINQLTSQINNLTQIIAVIKGGFFSIDAGVGILNIIINGFQIINRTNELVKNHHSKKLYSVLNNHLKATTRNPIITEEEKYSNEVLQFNALAAHYLKKLEQKSLINALGLNFIWATFGILSTINGVAGLILVIGVSAAAVLSSVASMGISMFFGAVAIPVALLVFRELKLKKHLVFANQTVKSLQRALAHHQPHLKEKNRLFLQVFLNNIENSMGLAIYGTKMQYYQSILSKNNTTYKTEFYLGKLWHFRRKALKYWHKLSSDQKCQGYLNDMVHDELLRQMVDIDQKRLNNVIPTTFRNNIDFLLEAFHPVISSASTGTLLNQSHLHYNELFSYEWDEHLSLLFNHTYKIYGNIRRNIYEYLYLIHKNNIQTLYFDNGLNRSEVKRLLKRYKRRQKDNLDTLRYHNLNESMLMLKALHKPVTKKEEEEVIWDDKFLPELFQLMDFDDDLKAHIKKLNGAFNDHSTLELPPHPRIETLIQYFLPLSFLNNSL